MSVLLFCILHKLRQFLRFGCVNIVSTDDDDDFEIEKRSSTTQTVSLLLLLIKEKWSLLFRHTALLQ